MRKKQAIVRSLLVILSRLPLPVLQGIGVILGLLTYLAAPRYRRRIHENLIQADLCRCPPCYRLYFSVAAELGKGFMELPAIWFRPTPLVLRLVKACHGWEHVEAAKRCGQPILAISPHLGCFELTSLYWGSRLPITALYRPPRMAWLEDILLEGREQSLVRLVPADRSGIKALIATLKRKETIGLLPDQAPADGEGVWVSFFGRPAYTPILPARLAQASHASVLVGCTERLSWGRGYRIWIEPLQQALPKDTAQATQILNEAMETLIRRFPTQYLWSYARYKIRGKGKRPPPPPIGEPQASASVVGLGLCDDN
jgi:Kdo2-lipid IVA lauroyltransferase/acyltransferase